MQQGKIMLYATGGFGVNICSHFFQHDVPATAPGYSHLEAAFIDTSRSNLNRAGISEENTFVLEGVDGSGKIRTENHQAISKNVRNVLQNFKPLDMNIVVFSGAGGSGSVFGPLIVSELLARGLPTVVIMVGADESTISAYNTVKTIKTLEVMAKKNELPVVMYYRQNSPEIKRSDIDADCHYVIASLSMLCSRQNEELDSKDIANWVQFNRATEAPARLARLMICNNEDADLVIDPISIASLLPDPDAKSFTTVPEYHCAGYPREPKLHDVLPRHLVTTFDGIPKIAQRLNDRIEELETQRRARVHHDDLIGDAEVSEDGMVL